MNPEDFKSERTGKLLRTLEGHYAFHPNLMSANINLGLELWCALSEADRRISALDGAASKLPNPHLLIFPFTRKEAVLSSKIEGTMASLSDLISFEVLGLFPEDQPERKDDLREVSNYVHALEYSLARIKEIPISLRLIKEVHGYLMKGVRGEEMAPGEFRSRQNWIGPRTNTKIEDATFVPPPVSAMHDALGDLEKFLHADHKLPPLLKLAIVHYQFEAIHPFLDGNGRIGRLLVTIMLMSEKLLSQPLLYLSAYFEKHRAEYYERLLRVSQAGEIEEWVLFFLAAVAEQAKDALERANKLQTLQQEFKQRLAGKRTSGHLLTLAEELFARPVVTAKKVKERFNVTVKSAQDYIDKLIDAKILVEVTGKQRYRVYLAPEIFRILD